MLMSHPGLPSLGRSSFGAMARPFLGTPWSLALFNSAEVHVHIPEHLAGIASESHPADDWAPSSLPVHGVSHQARACNMERFVLIGQILDSSAVAAPTRCESAVRTFYATLLL